jgi:lysophospholipase L1-like esterase
LHVNVCGYSGKWCDELFHRLHEALHAAAAAGHAYDVVILLGGTNDLSDSSGRPEQMAREADTVFARLHRMYALVRPDIGSLQPVTTPAASAEAPLAAASALGKRAPKLVAITIPQTVNFGAPYANLRAAINARIKAIPANIMAVVDAETEIPYYSVDADGKPGKMNAALWDDELHMTAAGYDALGELVFARAIEPWLKSQWSSGAQ